MIKRIAVITSLLLASAVPVATHAQEAALRLCTGGESGRYYLTGTELAASLKGTVPVTLIKTNGSLDNLRKLEAGECDAAIVQADAYGVFTQTNPVSRLNIERIVPLYNEYAHFVCNRDLGINSVRDILGKDVTLMTGPQNSGTAVTWASLVKQSPDYAAIKTDATPINNRAIAKLVDGVDAQCGLFISGLGVGSILDAEQNANGKIGLISFNDGAFDDVVDPKGKRVYENTEIPGGTYPNLQNYGFLGGQTNIPTIYQSAVLVANVAWADANAAAYDDFAGAALQWVQQRQK